MKKHIPRGKRAPSQRSQAMLPISGATPSGARVLIGQDDETEFVNHNTAKRTTTVKRLVRVMRHYHDSKGRSRDGYKDFVHQCAKNGIVVRAVDERLARLLTRGEGETTFEVVASEEVLISFLTMCVNMLVPNSAICPVVVHALPRQGAGACNADSAGAAKKKIKRSIQGRERRADDGTVIGVGRNTHASNGRREERGRNQQFVSGWYLPTTIRRNGQSKAVLEPRGTNNEDHLGIEREPVYCQGWYTIDSEKNWPIKPVEKSPEQNAKAERVLVPVVAQRLAFLRAAAIAAQGRVAARHLAALADYLDALPQDEASAETIDGLALAWLTERGLDLEALLTAQADANGPMRYPGDRV